MTVMDGIINQNGSSASILQNTGSVEDSYGYGDTVPTWETEATETVWIQELQSARVTQKLLRTLAGVIDESTMIGFFKTNTVAAKGKIVVDGSDRYMIEELLEATMFKSLSHYEGHLQLLEEG